VGRRTLLLIASILVAALGTALIWLYVQGADSRAQQSTALVKVLVLTKDASAGADATSLAFEPRDVPTSSFPGAIVSPQQLVGQKLAIPAVAGTVLLPGMLGKTSLQNARFPSGGAVALTIAEANRVPADLSPGDTVNVYSLGARGDSPRLEVRGIKVRSIGALRQPGAGGTTAAATVNGSIVGFDADQQQAERLYSLVNAGTQVALYDVRTGPNG